MKRTLLSLIAAVLTLSASAQLREDAFIIRTTDGAAQGLLFGDVEKITFSNLDDEGVPHTGVYYQELHYPDTIIRVPVSEVKEVSFDKPKTKLQPNVINGKETGLFNYIDIFSVQENGHDLYFDKETPNELVPEIGQIITYFDVDIQKIGNSPFAGRVKSIEKDYFGRYIIKTEVLESIHDIYKELVGVEAISDETPGVQEAMRRANAMPKGNGQNKVQKIKYDDIFETSASIPFDIPIGYSFKDEDKYDNSNLSSDRSFSLFGGVKGNASIRLTYDFTEENEYLGVVSVIESTPYFKTEFSANGGWELLWPKDPAIDHPLIKFVPPSAPIFTINLGAGIFLKFSGSAKLSLEKTFDTSLTRYFSYYDKGEYCTRSRDLKGLPENKGLDYSGDFNISLSLEGSASFGAYMGLYAGTDVFQTNIGILGEIYAGPKVSGTISMTPSLPAGTGEPSTVGYNMLKDNNVSVTWCGVEMALSYYQRIFGGEPDKVTFANLNCDINPTTFSLVPEFEPLTWEIPLKSEIETWSTQWYQPTKAKIAVPCPEGNWFLPIHYGYALYDENDKFIRSDYSTYSKWTGTIEEKDKEDIVFEYDQWLPNKKYKIYPAFKMVTISAIEEFRADPSRTLDALEGSITTGEAKTWLQKVEDYNIPQIYASISAGVSENVRKCPGFGQVEILIDENPDNLWADEDNNYGCNIVNFASTNQEPYDTEFIGYTGIMVDGNFSHHFEFSKKYYYRAMTRLQTNEGTKILYGETMSFTTPDNPDEDD